MMVSRRRILGLEIFPVERFGEKSYYSRDRRKAQGGSETVRKSGAHHLMCAAFSHCLTASLRLSPCLYTASDKLVKLKSFTLIGGTTTAPPASVPANRTGLPIASKLFSINNGESLKRKFLTAFEI